MTKDKASKCPDVLPAVEGPALKPSRDIKSGTEGIEAARNRVMARRILAQRSAREVICLPIFGEPAWEVLLRLYAVEGGALKAEDVVEDTGAPASVANRWLDYLEDQRLVVRLENPFDRRIAQLRLTNRATELLDSYFVRLRSID